MSAICQQDPDKLNISRPIIRFMNHSGFIISCETVVLVIDYYTDPEASLAPYIDGDKRLVYLVSHSHYDHWNPDILQWRSNLESIYLLDDTCKEYFNINPFELKNKKIKFIRPYNDINEIQNLNLPFEYFKVFASTDSGSSIFFKIDGVSFFHAGDLNNWDWKDEDSPKMEKDYRDELKKLKLYLSEIGEKIDFAFVPVDGRLLDRALSGAEIFIDEFKPKFLIPIHLNGGLDNPSRLAKSEYGKMSRIINLQRPGDQVDSKGLRIPPCLKEIY